MENENMNQQVEPKRTKKGVIIGCILIVIGLGIGLLFYNSYTNVNPVINQNSNNNNNFFYMKEMENPMNNFINEDNNLDEQLEKLNNVIIILKSDIDRVRIGIDELKELLDLLY